MIKHGKVFQFALRSTLPSHLDPISKFVTKGVADAKERVVLQPMPCDVKGAKRHDGQMCVIAKALTRTMKPEAVAVGRSLAYVVQGGVAIRFRLPKASQQLVEEFDEKGRVRKAPIELWEVNKAWGIAAQRASSKRKARTARKAARSDIGRKRRAKKYNVRAVGGGMAA